MIEVGLKWALVMTSDLPEIADEGPDMSDSERASWSLHWDQMAVGDLRRLARYHRLGEMTRPREARYRHLLHEPRDAMPLIERLQLPRPSMLGE